MFRNPDSIDTGQIILRPHEVTFDDIDDHGRSAVWDAVLDRFFKPNPLIGSGLGATQAWFYSGGYPYAGIRVEHSTYVRLLADIGLVGLVLFVATMLSCLHSAWMLFRTSPFPHVRWCALIVLCTFPALMFCMGFDNLINYVLPATQFPFAFTGLALGMAERARLQARYARQRRLQRPPGPPEGSPLLEDSHVGQVPAEIDRQSGVPENPIPG
jgi:O-antigen ligase